jgi:hypothetical protein
VRRFLFAMFLALDLLGSALTGGAPWQTISARFGKGRAAGGLLATWGANATDWVARTVFASRRHCAVSLEDYEARNRAVPSSL